ncbi:MAG: hypothetical protein K2X60_04950 [Xanthobacteraceae bacterium]|nr:hypothetical protein [Xanthobacteraceae bacterium]
MMTRLILACTAAFVLATPAFADMVARESDISGIRLGQHFLVDDGSCPAGQIKQITGTKLTDKGITSVKKCVDRKTAKR